MTHLRYLCLLLLALGGCFRPAIPINMEPNYPVDVFYNNDRPQQPYTEIQLLEHTEETPLAEKEKPRRGGRLLNRGMTMEEKELILAKMTLQAKRLGADALINVRYQFFTNASVSGFRMSGTAVRYQ